MSNSPLATYTNITKNKTSPRNHAIDTITIHCFVGQVTAQRGCDYFATTDRQYSSNYVVGHDGSIGLSVDEKDRSWCSGGTLTVNGISGSTNDHRAVTIEVASETEHPYKVTDAAYKALVELVADICKRNGIKKLLWKGNKNLVGKVDQQNMTVHRWFAHKACPGDYLYNLHGQLAEEVNKKLGISTTTEEKPNINENITSDKLYRVQLGAFEKSANATAYKNKIIAAGFEAFIVQVGKYYKVQVGAFSKKENAEALMKKLKAAGFGDAFLVYGGNGGSVTKTSEIKVGDKVKVLKAVTYAGKTFKLYYSKYDVLEVNGDRIVIGIGKTVTAAVHKDNLQKV